MESVVAALVTGVLTLAGVIVSNSRSRAVMEVKIDNLARQVERHNRMVERTYLPVRKFLALKRPLLESKSLYAIIENDYREKIRVAEEEFFASIARPADARLLDIAENAPVLDLVRTTYSIDNEIVEYTLSVARADQFKYKVYHKRMD